MDNSSSAPSDLKSDILRSFEEQDECSPIDVTPIKFKQKKMKAPRLNTNDLKHSIS